MYQFTYSYRNPIWISVVLSDYQFYLTDEEMESGGANVISPRLHSHDRSMTQSLDGLAPDIALFIIFY